MYGRGIGSIFSKLFRFVSPLVKKGFAIAKPHLKTAASSIASDVFSRVGKFVTGDQKQEGSGGIMVLARRQRRRPPGERLSNSKKHSASKKKKTVARRKQTKRKSPHSSDIF